MESFKTSHTLTLLLLSIYLIKLNHLISLRFSYLKILSETHLTHNMDLNIDRQIMSNFHIRRLK
jgi:hypothetical protein